MLVKLLINIGKKEIFLAGFDGYSYISEQNYAESDTQLAYKREDLDALNQGMVKVLSEYKNFVDIKFLTQERFIKI